jgi:anthranilate phosphoribosyltransferase
VTEAIRNAIAGIVSGIPLARAQSEAVWGAILDGEATPAQIAALLIGMRMRGETTDELTGLVSAMRARVVVVPAPDGTIDTCGTGGDAHQTFNISTAASLLTAAAGVPVAKHGNRAVSSRSGSSDAVAALGLDVDETADAAALSLREDGYAFLHAPAFHPGMRHVGPVRRELAIRTAFNLCGPLANPAFPRRQLVGVGDPDAARHVAEVLHALGVERAFVVHGDRIDELPLDDSGVVYDVSAAGVVRRTLTAAEAGLPRADTTALAGGEPLVSAAIIESVLRGTQTGPARDVVLLNSGAALVVAGHADDIRDGVALALRAITSGAALDQLERLRARAIRTATARAQAAEAAVVAASNQPALTTESAA